MVAWETDSPLSDLNRLSSFSGLVGDPMPEDTKSRSTPSFSFSFLMSWRSTMSFRYVSSKRLFRYLLFSSSPSSSSTCGIPPYVQYWAHAWKKSLGTRAGTLRRRAASR